MTYDAAKEVLTGPRSARLRRVDDLYFRGVVQGDENAIKLLHTVTVLLLLSPQDAPDGGSEDEADFDAAANDNELDVCVAA